MKSSNKLKLLAIQLFDDFEILNQINLILNFNDLKKEFFKFLSL